MSRETLSGLGRMFDHLSLGLAASAALALALLAQPAWLGVASGLALLFGALGVWWAVQRREVHRLGELRAHVQAQRRLAELLLPVWHGQIQMAGQHCAQATEVLASRLSTVVLQIGRALPHAAAADGANASAWQAERDLILAEIRECTLQLQFQDRVDQVLAHVRHNLDACREGLTETCNRFDVTGRVDALDVEQLLTLLEASYATEEEHVVHQGHLAMSEAPRRATASADEAITYF
ncbi:MAG: hypothetical protein JO006_10235 [Paucibacter sp.]|nr:hypothetical protein [Roseateles sp.]